MCRYDGRLTVILYVSTKSEELKAAAHGSNCAKKENMGVMEMELGEGIERQWDKQSEVVLEMDSYIINMTTGTTAMLGLKPGNSKKCSVDHHSLVTTITTLNSVLKLC